MNPKRLSYLQAGWKFLDLQPPVDPPPEGKEYRISGYTETATDIRPIFKLVPVVSPPRTFSKLRLITNNPVKRVGLEGYGLEIVENIPVIIEPNKYNRRYLETKRIRMGHKL